jgi:hypothetical protein
MAFTATLKTVVDIVGADTDSYSFLAGGVLCIERHDEGQAYYFPPTEVAFLKADIDHPPGTRTTD